MVSGTTARPLLFFAIIYLGMTIDVGLFDPLISCILRLVMNDPEKLWSEKPS